MKTQQRKFVVEFKSGRRRSAKQPESIWGNADLKSLARQAQAEAPHLFEANTIGTASEKQGPSQPHSSPEKDIVFSAEAAGEYVGGLSVDTEHLGAPVEHKSGIAALDSLPEEQASQPQPPTIKRRRRRAGLEKAASVSERPSTPAPNDASRDELTVLYEENRQLKGLLAEHLLQQNVELRKMLERFGDV
ncbi:hypothetical protein [Rhizobium ruizarguesonis]|uniref:hypothetical protein n=1 Tax=Rhizobium TaxID=379 RepID=UPI0013BFC1F7|nr:hypothetical protein [Rhizobium ruizarguesonis]NEI96534.1 hypothetical protein [Rhizobium ruizarguesonis]NEJ33843.1 hypothetical protein [Rhizobium ruizarguesonis]